MTVPSGTIAKGQLARQVVGVDAVEIKATIAPRQISKVLGYFGASEALGEKRQIFFFDTPALKLFKSGLIMRARRKDGQAHDSTIKFRPVRPDKVSTSWHNDKGFKFEADATERAFVRSASLTRDIVKGLIKHVEDNKRPPKVLFDKSQEQFIAELSRKPASFDQVVPLGPLNALWWRIEHPGLPWPFVAELWIRPDGAKILEASVRVPIAQTAVAKAGFIAFLAELGAGLDKTQIAKTRWALDYFVRKHKTK